jgi:predicted pyridoxine 5'-phosphate oxidase superfamily flavin-nucleotide-binding protein
MIDLPYHAGEIAVQERAGERDVARSRGGIISSRIVPGALSFLKQQRLLALSTTGDDEQLWTSVWCARPGFVQSVDGERLTIARSLMIASPDDPVLRRLAVGRDVGMLAIEFASRRRLRINGTIERTSASDVRVVVRESVSNCPKYIQRRHAFEDSDRLSKGSPTGRGHALDAERRVIVERADTVFVGSLHRERGVDTSHRGGTAGFIQVVNETTLRIPDYAGNSMFMTLGNYAVDDRASVALLDFEAAQVLSFSGSARLDFGVESPQHPTGGTGRYWEFEVKEWVQFELSCGLRWEWLDASPFNPPAPK